MCWEYIKFPVLFFEVLTKLGPVKWPCRLSSVHSDLTGHFKPSKTLTGLNNYICFGFSHALLHSLENEMPIEIRFGLFPLASKHNCPLNIPSLQIFVWHHFLCKLGLFKYPSLCMCTPGSVKYWGKIFWIYTLAIGGDFMTIQYKYCGMINLVLWGAAHSLSFVFKEEVRSELNHWLPVSLTPEQYQPRITSTR